MFSWTVQVLLQYYYWSDRMLSALDTESVPMGTTMRHRVRGPSLFAVWEEISNCGRLHAFANDPQIVCAISPKSLRVNECPKKIICAIILFTNNIFHGTGANGVA